MEKPLRILYLEDDSRDMELAELMLTNRSIACDMTRVDTRADFVSALEKGGFDLIFSDYKLPLFDGISALAIAKEKCPDVPFIIVSGSLGEEVAIETLKRGATDYVLKQNLLRLVPVVTRALNEAKERRERKHLEDQLRQAQKMESIGRFAGSIAHDFNNLLTVINGYTELRLAAMTSDDPARADLEEIRGAGHRSLELTRQLLTFSRQRMVEPKIVNLNEIILNMDKMFRRLIGEEIEFVTLPAQALGWIKADLGSIEQVIANLAVNARDAISGAGKIILETQDAFLHEEYTRQYVDLAPGRYVMLAVTDSGCGMPPEVKEHLFEPFFTTKEPGKGTGLGLSTCYGIVKQSGGHIHVYSEVGHGTTFKIYFPRVEKETAVVSDERKPGFIGNGCETVLLVEDQESVRRIANRVLSEHGYHVLEAVNGEEALRFLEENQKEEINLLLADVVMPKMGGKELFEKIKTAYPRMKALFTSGYTDNAMILQGVIDQNRSFIQKPFSPEALLTKVRELLDK